MDEASINLELRNTFFKSSLEDWKKIAVQETGGKDPFESLVWRGKDEFFFLPYYDAESADKLYVAGLPAATDAACQWLNLPLIKTQDPQQANVIALEHLMHGADGVVCDVRSMDPDLKALTNKFEWPHCYIGFYADNNPHFLKRFQDVIEDNSHPASVNGVLFRESIPDKKSDLEFYFESCPSFKALGLLIKSSSPANEISDALIEGVNMIETFKGKSSLEKVFSAIAFSLSADMTLIETVAKFRALRLLWFQIARAYGHDNHMLDALSLHARSEFVPDGAFGPHENMIKATFAAMGALMGGCNSITVEYNIDIPFTARCARNVSSILKEESFFNHTADPLAGAWAVEVVTDAIAKKAWELFQQKSKANATT